MSGTIFIILSILYLISLATIDGLFNRLVFKEKRKLSYSSSYKKNIYKKWEWKIIGIIFLIFLPLILPSVIAYMSGGITLVTTYWIIFLLVPWDMIFGALVFDNCFDDTPSIALPFYGWVNLPLWLVIIIRIILAIFLIVLKIKLWI
ncbi:hypothetical protein A3C23_00270 [Candidatus Roizmanbacteria bacterium RIFCSPHIGHO2_02_FULL_37_13b]|uniref:Uncharacterized protein n=1 Tax=Candidatus Roizmanbacteria bacterium RIFCSPLOWO2_02_FULL_36_11 TaxID=1802071 RepID=A0A1F7JHQ4_9BACT|nr:MAG: hypothetical protein A3C23_00270 [Candidatus Roizmanbacteria bacterium RIFCSPHIGHO2_02_FULL_37_13b]OGK55132.1 MAG: hypothetical protein A3H78_04080 [Candidatus Roizmanbacteria bacterium RIFCSPLOWO2_02_FULL_36_11]